MVLGDKDIFGIPKLTEITFCSGGHKLDHFYFDESKYRETVRGNFKEHGIRLHIDDEGKHCIPLPFTCLQQLNGGSMGGGGKISGFKKDVDYI